MMMMTGDHARLNPTVQIPSQDCFYLDDPTAHISSPISHPNNTDASSNYEKVLAALQRDLPSNKDDAVPADGEFSDEFHFLADAFSCDEFRMFDFKVKKCAIAWSHDWTECPFAHPGEKARRRDPRRFRYSGSACTDFRKGACRKGDACEHAHGVFECWLHPSRYRTQLCKDGDRCRRRVCFFAHSPEQLRLPASPDASPRGARFGHESFLSASLFSSSPRSTLLSPTAASPPVSPSGSVSQLSESMRRLQFGMMNMGLGLSVNPPSWGPVIMASAPRGLQRAAYSDEPLMETVGSGRQLRERIYAKLVEENSLDRFGPVGWSSVANSGRVDPAGL